MAALYLVDGKINWPSCNIKSMLVSAAKTKKEGKICTAACIVTGTDFIYDGPKTPEELWDFAPITKNPYVHRAIGVVNRQRVVITRPIFPEWSLEIKIKINNLMTDEASVREWIQIAGMQIGLGDWRPTYGRFDVV